MSKGWVCQRGGYVQGVSTHPPADMGPEVGGVPWTWNVGYHGIWLASRWYVSFLVRLSSPHTFSFA